MLYGERHRVWTIRQKYRRYLVKLCVATMISHLILYCFTADWPYTGWLLGENSVSLGKKKEIHHDHALVQGTLFMNKLTPDNNYLPAHGKKLCMVIITTHRLLPYMNSLMASLLTSDEEGLFKKTVELHILNAEQPPGHHTLLKNLQNQLHGQLHIHRSVRTKSRSRVINKSRVWHNNETQDYVNALRLCESSLSEWTVVIEEDAIVTKYFLHKFIKGVIRPFQELEENVAFVKLWTPDRWDGFEKSNSVSLIFTCSLISAALTALIHILLGSRNSRHLILLYIFVCLTVHSHVLLLGKQNIYWIFLKLYYGNRLWEQPELRPLANNHVSGTVAMAYPTARLPEIVSFIYEQLSHPVTAGLPVDLMICHYFLAKSSTLRAYEMLPSLAQHIGAYSSASDSDIAKNRGNFRRMSQDAKFV